MSEVDPISAFDALFARAKKTSVKEPNACVLATVDAKGRPSARVVLLKGADPQGFVFYTNLNSRKGRELRATRHAALCFHWPELEAQVRVEGDAAQVTDPEADAYFASRQRGSQVGAWASQQSEPLATRAELDRRVAEIEARYAGQSVPRPPHWSGFRLTPQQVEFWYGRPNRLHERTLYTRQGDQWRTELLYP